MKLRHLCLLLLLTGALCLFACQNGKAPSQGMQQESDPNQNGAMSSDPPVTAPDTALPDTTLTDTATTPPETEPPVCQAALTAMRVLAEDNLGMGCDATVEIGADRIQALFSLIASREVLSSLHVRLVCDGGSAAFSPDCLNADGTVNLNSDRCAVVVTDKAGITKTYRVLSEYRPLGIPTVAIQTNGQTIEREEYIRGSVQITSDGSAYNTFLPKTEVRIRGRGHSTWQMPKKPYKLKFDEKVSVLGLTAAKEWVLLANYADMSLLRNTVAFRTAKIADYLAFSPTQIPVNLFVDGKYVGVYSIGEQLEVETGRVELPSDTGEANTSFLLEIGGEEDRSNIGISAFHAGCFRWCAVKYPDEEDITPEQLAYIKQYILDAERAVKTGTGYEDYIDVNSLCDWVIIHELFYNLESCFRRSCYITKAPDGKLQFGPVWDFDLAIGNLYNDFGDYQSWMCLSQKHGYIEYNWLCDLMEDSVFRKRLRTRWDEIKDAILQTAIETVDTQSRLLAPSAVYNFRVWPTLGTRPVKPLPKDVVKLDTYQKHVDYVRSFIINRWNWLDANI